MTGIHSALTASIPDLRSEVPLTSFKLPPTNFPMQGQEREEEGGSEDIVTEVDNVLGKLMASLQKGNKDTNLNTNTHKNTNTHSNTDTQNQKHTHKVDNVLGKLMASLQ